MKTYFLRFFAVLGALFTVFFLIAAVATWYSIGRVEAAPEAPKEMVLHLDFTHPIIEETRGFDLSLGTLLREPDETSILSVLRALDRAKKDPRVKGVVARFGSANLELAHVQEIRDALARFRESGKFTIAFGPNFGDFGEGNKTYYLASAFEDLWLQPVGVVGLSGLGIEAPFGKQALDTLGVKADFVQREEYKSLMEHAQHQAFTPPVRANMQALLDDLQNQEIEGIAQSRKMDAAKVRALFAEGPFTDQEALDKGLVNHLGYWDEIEDALDEKAGKDSNDVDVATYLAFKPAGDDAKAEPKATVALITAEGLITDDPASGPMRFTDEATIDTQAIADAFADAADDDDVKAILFRVNSPGGSPAASETIRRAMVKAKEANKPIFVSMGAMAASGGYWIAMNADRIVAEPGTLTGSIGVVGGKFAIGGLSEKLGVSWDRIETSPNASLWSMATPFSPEQRARVNALMDSTYAAFTKNVAAARKLSPEKSGDFAKGRVFTGRQAVEIGLADELGGIETTIAALKKQLGLAAADKIALQRFPAPETPTSILFRMLKNLGLQSVSLQSSLGTLHKLETRFAPELQALNASPLQARLPAAFQRIGK